MRRKKMSFVKSRRQFKKRSGVHKINHLNPRRMRGGIRL